MLDKAKLAELSKNQEFLKKAQAIQDSEKDMMLKLLKEYGCDTNKEELNSLSSKQTGELSEDELSAVSGGDECACMIGGGSSRLQRNPRWVYHDCYYIGGAARDGDINEYQCWCVNGGGGDE